MSDSKNAPKQEDPPKDRLAKYRGDLAGAERQAAQMISLGKQHLLMAFGLVGFFLSLFLPHSGRVIGLDVLFYSETARAFVTTIPERIYIWLGVIGVLLLNGATLITRSALVAYLSWLFSGVDICYSIFAVWMRQSRPPTEPGAGPSFGLYLGAASAMLVFFALSSVVLRRNSFQAALAKARHQEDQEEHVVQLQQNILDNKRKASTESVFVDDRRSRAAERRARRRQEQEENKSSN